ncbi:MAG: 1-deoxy-D-xylulose-5-phosphate synthase [Neisseria sp.]|nr:1-deoxy-D-xylulose-5-phosphate synthase [Neisseria sp.]
MSTTPLLDTVPTPADLRRLPKSALPQVARELRAALMQSISRSGGHFASNLGVIELTVALHYVFDTPRDHLVWDVGHQAYAHKILTGRRAAMHTIRHKDGLAPFPKRDESEYDTFGVGHSSTSIGAALGMAVADRLSGSPRHSVAIIGDGAMTAGQAFEALNNAGDMRDVNLLVVLNDNEMSISHNVGALPKYLAQNMVHDVKDLIKDTGKQVLSILPGALDAARQVKSALKDIVNPALSLFNNFGFDYSGPIDGHDVLRLVDVLQELKHKQGPQLLHIHTKKGKGFAPAESDPVGFHAVGKFDAAHPPQQAVQAASAVTYTQVFGQWLCDTAQRDERLIGITPAMCEGSGMVEFARRFPTRYFDVGIAEQHAVTFAAGLACEGKKPIVAIYSTFLQRAYDQWIHDVALQSLPVLLAIDRAGIVGADGATHAGVYDLSFLRCVPNMVIATPSDENECRLLLNTCYALDQPTAVRYPRGSGTGAAVTCGEETAALGRGVLRRQGQKIALLAFGSMVATALQAAETLNASVADMRFVKPLDEELLRELAATHDYLVTLEENAVMGGAGSAVSECLHAQGCLKPLLHLGIPDIVTAHGDAKLILQDLGLDAASVTQRVQAWCGA